LRSRSPLVRARRLQDSSHGGLVVGRAWAAKGGVVVRGKDHPAGRIATLDRGDDILHPPGDGVGSGGACADALLHLDVDPQSPQLFDQVVADLVAACASDRRRLLTRDPLQVYPRALRAELRLWRGRRHWRRRSLCCLRPRHQRTQDRERADRYHDPTTAAKFYLTTFSKGVPGFSRCRWACGEFHARCLWSRDAESDVSRGSLAAVSLTRRCSLRPSRSRVSALNINRGSRVFVPLLPDKGF
jgi:hypothetical protein